MAASGGSVFHDPASCPWLLGGAAALSREQMSQPSNHQGLPLGHGAQEPGRDGWGTKVHLQGVQQRLQIGVCTCFKQNTSPVWNSSDVTSMC